MRIRRRPVALGSLLLAGLFVCGAVGGCSPSPSATVDVPLKGTLLLQKTTFSSSDMTTASAGFYELEAGWAEPRPATDLPFNADLVTGEVVAVSADGRYVVFSHSLLDVKTGTIHELSSKGWDASSAKFSPGGSYLAYEDGGGDVAVWDLPDGPGRQIYKPPCDDYVRESNNETVQECGDFSFGWLPGDLIGLAHYHDAMPSKIVGSELAANHLTVMDPSGATVASWDEPPEDDPFVGAKYYFGRDTVLRTAHSGNAWYDTGELASGRPEAHTLLDEFKYVTVRSLSPSGRYVVAELTTENMDETVVEVRTGQRRTLERAWDDPYGACLWSSDETEFACTTSSGLWLVPGSAGLTAGKLVSRPQEADYRWNLVAWS